MRLTSKVPLSVPVAKPLLPDADALLPYLRRIDSSRIYSNFGPMVRSLEERLTAHFREPSGSVTMVANATLGLTLALLAQTPKRGALCVMPAWSFAASAHAAVMAGLQPYFLDVDPNTGMLLPETTLQILARFPQGRVGAVMPVAPFGCPVDTAAWDRFHEQTRIPVVIDAAAGFDSLRPGRTPAVVSLHATKILSAGEGGFVIARDKSLISEIERRSNFGFMGGRDARVPATNAKLSEYNACVALASLDAWSSTRTRFTGVAQTYARHLRQLSGIRLQPGFGTDWVSSTAIVTFVGKTVPMEGVADVMADAGVATRRWWGRGLHHEAAFSDYGREKLPSTDRLAATTLGLPCFPDMRRTDIVKICNLLGASVEGSLQDVARSHLDRAVVYAA